MAIVSLCFSGQPRTFLAYKDHWQRYFAMIRSQHDLRIFFHSWADQGLVKSQDNRFIEGSYESVRYAQFDELTAFLEPCAYRIDTPCYSYKQIIRSLGLLYMSAVQANPSAIISQIHSISIVDKLRKAWDLCQGRSDVVIKLRFDLVPSHLTLNEINYITAYPDRHVLFAPNPCWHGHPGGGGGCNICHKFFDENRLHDDYALKARDFLQHHFCHTNDICDLFAIGRPETMDKYCSMFDNIDDIYGKIKNNLGDYTQDYILIHEHNENNIVKISSTKSGTFDIEASPIFVPEKFIRQAMSGNILVHGESSFIIARR